MRRAIAAIEEERAMTYVTRIERIGREGGAILKAVFGVHY